MISLAFLHVSLKCVVMSEQGLIRLVIEKQWGKTFALQFLHSAGDSFSALPKGFFFLVTLLFYLNSFMNTLVQPVLVFSTV